MTRSTVDSSVFTIDHDVLEGEMSDYSDETATLDISVTGTIISGVSRPNSAGADISISTIRME